MARSPGNGGGQNGDDAAAAPKTLCAVGNIASLLSCFITFPLRNPHTMAAMISATISPA